MIQSKFGEHLETGIAINGTATFDLPVEVTRHPDVAVKVWFRDSGADATPSAGTITSVSLAFVGNPDEYEVMANASSLDATAIIPLLDAFGHYVSCQIITDSLADVDEVVVKFVASGG